MRQRTVVSSDNAEPAAQHFSPIVTKNGITPSVKEIPPPSNDGADIHVDQDDPEIRRRKLLLAAEARFKTKSE